MMWLSFRRLARGRLRVFGAGLGGMGAPVPICNVKSVGAGLSLSRGRGGAKFSHMRL